jgi:thiol:disulfide interchange protein DsbD
MKSTLFVALLVTLFSVTTFAAASTMISQQHLALTLLGFFSMGVLLSFTPCVLPMVPILSAILIGQKKISALRSLALSLVFVLSMSVTYAAAGVAAGYLGTTVQTTLQSPWIIISFSLIFVLMGLSMFGLFNFAMPPFLQNRLHGTSNRLQSGNMASVAIMGVLSTLIASPCVTAPLVSVLTYISQTGNAGYGGLILFVLSLGMGLPLIIFGTGQGAILPKAGPWMNHIKTMFGFMSLGLAIWMLSRIVPGVITLYLWGALFIVGAIVLGALNFRGEKRLPPVLQGISFLALVYGSILLIGAAKGHDSLINPLQSPLLLTADKAKPVDTLFSTVKDITDLQQRLKTAKEKKQPVMLEFYASWCPSCKALDRDVLSNAKIQQQMQGFTKLRVDMTDRSDTMMYIATYYQVYGTPTVIFFDHDGKEIKSELFNDGITTAGLSQVLKRLA